MKLRENAGINAALDAMLASFDTQDDPYLGPFWYDPTKQELYGYILTLAKDVPFYKSNQWKKDVKTGNALHQNIWQKETHRNRDERFTGNYTMKPRGRVFEFKDEGFKVFTGRWIEQYPEAKEEILDIFQLPKDKTEFIQDEHWDIGHGWSNEF